MNTETQKQAIADWLLLGNELDSLSAIKLFGCTKLSTRIGELERENKLPTIKRDWKEVKTRFCDKVKVRTYKVWSKSIMP